jgi:hypothetical protein
MKKTIVSLLLIALCFAIDATFGAVTFGVWGMALIRFSDVVSEARGSIGGTTFSRNRAGAIARKRTKPVNTQTTFRDAVRALFGSISQQWRELTPAQRDNWDTMAPEYQAINALGENFTYTGSQLFQKLNSSLQLAGLAGITAVSAPQEVNANPTTGFDADINGPAFDVELSAAIPVGSHLVVEATPLISAGIKNVANKFKQIKVMDTADGASLDVNADYIARYGQGIAGMVEGDVFYIRTTVVMDNNGQRGVPFVFRVVVADTTP